MLKTVIFSPPIKQNHEKHSGDARMAGADSPQECNTRESIISIRRKDIGILL